MLGLTPDPLSAGVGMHVAVAGPSRLTEHARRTARSPACRKRPFTTQADRRLHGAPAGGRTDRMTG